MDQQGAAQDSWRSLEEQGCDLAESGRYHDAIACLRIATDRGCESAKLHEMLAQCLLEIAHTQEAVVAATTAVELDPEV